MKPYRSIMKNNASLNFFRLLIVGGFITLLFFAIAGCSKSSPSSRARLLLVLTVDQLSQDYIERFDAFFTGGLRYLRDQGAFFSQAYYTHADTATCPGHSVIVTGVQPSKSGIIGNWWYDREQRETVYCVDDARYGRSPRKLLVSSLPDWIEEESWWGKVYAASGKDRSAIMLGGKKADAAFWYDKSTGKMTSSQFYEKASPSWLAQFNQEQRAHKFFGRAWEPLPVSESALEKAKVRNLDRGVFRRGFPHSIGGASLSPDQSFYEGLYASPFIDEYLTDFAKELIEAEELGQDSRLDYLGLSYSALDSVGHGFGPNSPEVLDTLLRLDASLKDLFSFIDQHIGLHNVVIALSSDHGVQPLPEYLESIGVSAHRQDAVDVACMQRVGVEISEEYGVENLFLADLYLDHELIARKNLAFEDVEERVRKRLSACPMIERVWTRRELLAGESVDSSFLPLYQSTFHPQRSGDFLVQLKHWHLHSLYDGTGHGSPYDYDTHVPIIIAGPGILGKRIEQRIAMVDLAPTLAELLDVKWPRSLDGVDRTELLIAG